MLQIFSIYINKIINCYGIILLYNSTGLKLKWTD